MRGFLTYSAAFIFFVTGVKCMEVIWPNVDHLATEKTKCLEEGRFAHPYNCGGYVECVRNPEGLFKRRFGTCHGGFFSQKFKSCSMDNTEDIECKRLARVARSATTDRRHSDICSEIINGFVCADCKTAVNCVEGIAYTDTCGSGDTCTEKPEFGGAVCYPTPAENCTCSDTNQFFIDAYDPQAFFFCGENGTEPELYHCPEGMAFDVEFAQCTNNDGMPHCMEAGVFPYYSNCLQYYTCIASQDGWVQKSFSCGDNLMYNEDTGNCEDPCIWDTGSFTCQNEGRFVDPLSCEHYYECVQEGESFRQDHRQCPVGYQWDPEAMLGNGHCMRDSTNTCTPVKVSRCIIPEGQCSAGGSDFPIEDPPLPPPVRRFGNARPYSSAQTRLWHVLSRGERRSRSRDLSVLSSLA